MRAPPQRADAVYLVCDSAVATQQEILLKKAALARKPIHTVLVNLNDVRYPPHPASIILIPYPRPASPTPASPSAMPERLSNLCPPELC